MPPSLPLVHWPVRGQTHGSAHLTSHDLLLQLGVLVVNPVRDGFETTYDCKPNIAHHDHIFLEYGLLALHTERRNSDRPVAFWALQSRYFPDFP